VRVEEYAYYVNKLRQIVGLENDYDVKLWRYKEHTPNANDHHLPLIYTPPHENFLRTPLQLAARRLFMIGILGCLFAKKKYFTD